MLCKNRATGPDCAVIITGTVGGPRESPCKTSREEIPSASSTHRLPDHIDAPTGRYPPQPS